MITMILNFLSKKQVYTPIITIILGYLLYRLIKNALEKLMHETDNAYNNKKRKTVIELSSNIAKYIIIIIGCIIILQAYGIDTASIIAGLGVLSAVVGLAFQDTLKDLIAGVTIILENYYIVGDYVKYKDFTGEVTVIGLKSTKIRNCYGETLILANHNVNEIINLSQTKQSIFIPITIAYEEEITVVEKAIKNILPKLEKVKNVIPSSATYLGVDELSASSVNYLIKINCTQDKQWQVKRDCLAIIKDELDKNNIKIPYPQIEVHNGKNI